MMECLSNALITLMPLTLIISIASLFMYAAYTWAVIWCHLLHGFLMYTVYWKAAVVLVPNLSSLVLPYATIGCRYCMTTLIARFMGPTWGPTVADRTQVGPMLAPWTLLSGNQRCHQREQSCHHYNTVLTHWGRVTGICVGKLAIIVSDNGLSPGRIQAIIRINAGILLTGPLGTNISET